MYGGSDSNSDSEGSAVTIKRCGTPDMALDFGPRSARPTRSSPSSTRASSAPPYPSESYANNDIKTDTLEDFAADRPEQVKLRVEKEGPTKRRL